MEVSTLTVPVSLVGFSTTFLPISISTSAASLPALSPVITSCRWTVLRSVTSQVPSSVLRVSTVFSTFTSGLWCCGSGWLPFGTFETVTSVWTTGVPEHDFPMTPTASCEAWVSVRFHSPPGVCSTRTSSPISETLTEESEVLLVTVVSVTPRRVLRITCCAVTSLVSSTVVRLTSHVPSSVARDCTW